jgi:hypothetical protein
MSDFGEVFAILRQLMIEAAPGQLVAKDVPGDLVMHTDQSDPKTGRPVWFGAVATKKSYVAFHLFPLYEHPALAEGISPSLGKRRQGKSCFNFKAMDPELFEELRDLVGRAVCATS